MTCQIIFVVWTFSSVYPNIIFFFKSTDTLAAPATIKVNVKIVEIKNIYKTDGLEKLVTCSEKCQMLFNFWKCKSLHTGHGM